VRNSCHMLGRSEIGGDVPACLAVAIPALFVTGRRWATERLGIERTAARAAPQVSLARIGFVRPQHFRRRPMTRRRAIGVQVDCRCGAVGRSERTGISWSWREVHFPPQPAFLDYAGGINGRYTSCALAIAAPTNGRQDKSAAFGRAHVAGWIEVICWHVAWPCWRFRRERQSFQQAQRHRRSYCDQLESGSVAPRALRPFCSGQVSWHTVTMARPHKSRRFVSGPGRKKESGQT
jgi:hypothetical protein